MKMFTSEFKNYGYCCAELSRAELCSIQMFPYENMCTYTHALCVLSRSLAEPWMQQRREKKSLFYYIVCVSTICSVIFSSLVNFILAKTQDDVLFLLWIYIFAHVVSPIHILSFLLWLLLV